MIKMCKPSKPAGRTAVYRLFNAEGELLYVGCSYNPAGRCTDHAKRKRWWGEVADRTDEWHATRVLAESAEKRAIAAERPKYNVLHTPLHTKVCYRFTELTQEEGALWARTWGTDVPASYGSTPDSCGFRALSARMP